MFYLPNCCFSQWHPDIIIIFASLFFFFLQVWSTELADVARVNACQCNFQYADLPPIPFRHHHARENHVYYPAANLGSMVEYWYLENENYNYHSRQCDRRTICEHYLNVSNDKEAMVHGSTEELSCQANSCHFSSIVDCLGPSM